MVSAGLLLAHAAVIASLLFGGGRQLAATPPIAIAVTEVRDAAPAAMPEPTVIAVSAQIEPPRFDISEDEVAQMPGSGCALSDAVQAALGASPAVKDALGLVPASARSVAGAMLIWDGHWVAAETIGGAGALRPIEAAVVAIVRAAPADCRTAPVIGPRLIFVAEASGMRVLAFGSGVWRWSQLLAEPNVITGATSVEHRNEIKILMNAT